jgi:hypothetical protein
MIKKYFRVYYAYRGENHHQEFWIRARIIDHEKINDKAWEMIRKANSEAKRDEISGVSIQEIDAF